MPLTFRVRGQNSTPQLGAGWGVGEGGFHRPQTPDTTRDHGHLTGQNLLLQHRALAEDSV